LQIVGLAGFLLVNVVAHGLAARWAMRAFPRLGRHPRSVAAGVALVAIVPVAARVLLRTSDRSGLVASLFAASMVEVLAVLLAVIPVTLGSELLRAVSRRRASRAVAPSSPGPARENPETADAPGIPDGLEAPEAPAAPEPVGRRVFVERAAGVAVFASSGLALGWGGIRGRHAFQLEEVVVKVAGWPRVLDGYTLVQISDVHMGAFVGERELDEGFELVRRARPDLLVATGDLVDFRAELVGPLARRMAGVGARDGAAAIVGNHDHYAGAEEVVERLRAARVTVLCNEGQVLRADDGGGFALLGLDDLHARRNPQPGFPGPDLSRAIAGVPRDLPRILLAHQPSFFTESAGRVSLQLSGHTHGGQINPGFRPADLFMRYVSGRYEKSGSTLWVNRGFGVAGAPSRVGAPPEVTRVVIVAS